MKAFGELLHTIYNSRPAISICDCDCKRCRDTGIKYKPSDSTFDFCDYCSRGPLVKEVIRHAKLYLMRSADSRRSG